MAKKRKARKGYSGPSAERRVLSEKKRHSDAAKCVIPTLNLDDSSLRADGTPVV
jgi:hypothetical protein